MKYRLLFIVCSLLCFSELWAGPGKVVVKGADQNVCVYNSSRGRGRACFAPEKGMKETVILLPEKECGDLFYLISGDRTSWIRVLPDETVTVDVRKKDWKFAGDSKAINRYLYQWTQKMFFGKPNALTYRVEMMFYQLPDRDKRIPDPKTFYTKEYMEWADRLVIACLRDLREAKIKDSKFIEEQEGRILFGWVELQMLNYQMVENKEEIPEKAYLFLDDFNFADVVFLKYPGADDILRIYFDMVDARGMIQYDNYNFLQRRAEMIENAEVREYYILQELDNIIRNQWLYQLDKVIASVENMVITQAGKEQLTGYKKQYQDLMASDVNQEGKKAVNISFKDVNDREWGLYMFKGKYVLIDVWATWCGPCRAEIPHLKEAYKEYSNKGVAFFSVSIDKDDAAWRKAMKEENMPWAQAQAPKAGKDVMKQYQFSGIPYILVLDKEGKIVAKNLRGKALTDKLEELLSGKKKSVAMPAMGM